MYILILTDMTASKQIYKTQIHVPIMFTVMYANESVKKSSKQRITNNKAMDIMKIDLSEDFQSCFS